MADGEPVIDGDTGQPDFLVTLLAMASLGIVDTWNTLGMRTAGSNDVIIPGVFVSEPPNRTGDPPRRRNIPTGVSVGWGLRRWVERVLRFGSFWATTPITHTEQGSNVY